MVCVLPFIGLACYFLSSGLHREIEVAQEKRAGLGHVSKTVSALSAAVRLAWSESGDNPEEMQAMDLALSALGEAEASLSPARMPDPSSLPASVAPDKGKDARALWQEVKAASPSSPERLVALRNLTEQLHQGIFETTHSTGLRSGAENEISALTDIVAAGMPVHVERLLHMHESMLPDLKTNGWDAASRRVAEVFARQLVNEDITRLKRSISAALDADRRSAHVTASFQNNYPAQAEALLGGLLRLSETIMVSSGAAGQPPLNPLAFDEALDQAFESAVAGWNASILQLDTLVKDQIDEAGRRRNQALLLTALVSLVLLPLAWLYFRMCIRPVMQVIIDDAANLQREAEAARAEADETTRRLRQTQAALFGHNCVTVVDLERRILAVNDRLSMLFGFSREKLEGCLFDAFLCPEEGVDRMPEIWSTVEKGSVWNGSLCHVAENGRHLWVNATIFPFLNQEGTPVEFVVIETDITELVEARQGAEEAARAKSQFLAMMSHEIRTPLNGVIGFAQILSETPLNGDQRDYVRTILTSGESLLVIINDILDFSKLDVNRTELELHPVSLEVLVEDILELLAPQARAKNVEIAYCFEAAVPKGIMADGPRLRQVLLNLAGNALKFTPAGHVEILAALDLPGQLSFHVRDSGIGIPVERRGRLFQAFSQVDVSDSRYYGGTGLGLAISQRLVGLMGGKIVVESEPGKGSDFHFSIPFDAAEVPEWQDPVRMKEISASLRGRRILVVDDLEASRRFLKNVLTNHGAETVVTASADDALEAVLRHSFDLAVLDQTMPDGNGISLAGKIRANAGSRNLPLVLMTSITPDSETTDSGLFQAVFPKPLRAEAFVSAVAGLLHKNSQLSSLASSSPASRAGDGVAGFAAAHPLEIAVVDDNPVNLKFMRALLRTVGYDPVLFSNAHAALDSLESRKFDLVLMDIQMPGMDGHEATLRLRQGKAGGLNQDCKVIALTAGVMAEERAACLAAGMDDFISKPVSRSELLEKLAAVAGNPSAARPSD